MRPGRRPSPALWLSLLALAVPAQAAASYGNAADDADGAQLISADYERLEQGDDTTDYAAVSAGGRYVAIQTRARNFFADDDPDPAGGYRVGGIFRFDLETDRLEKVADGDLVEEESNDFLRRGAANPSISGDGRFVAFSTAESLVAADANERIDVYVRDMDVPAGEPGAYELVSVRDGGDDPAAYGPPPVPFPGNEPGADVSRGVAISADGQRVVFRTAVASDLPAAGGVEVPAGQLFLRDRASDSTILVTAARNPGTGEMTGDPAGGAVGAALSADGTTVAWTGGNAGEQTRFLGGENVEPGYLHYLWRRVADGPQAPTRRITGVADPDDPACPPESITNFNRTSTGPCYGPLADRESGPANISAQLPVLSGDGMRVAFLTGSGPRPLESTSPGLDLFVTEMTPGLTRKEATVELTRDTIGDPATSPPIGSVAMSASGRYLALATVRTSFALPALQLLGEERAVPGPRELYVVDLEGRTLERVAHSYLGDDIDSDVQNGPTLSADGGRVAFTSFAGNLFFGDANQRADAFVATRTPDPPGGGAEEDPDGGGPAATIEVDRDAPQIGVRVRSKANGVVVAIVSVPDAGGVRAVAKAQAGEPRRVRTLATAGGRATGAGRSSVRLELRPVERYRPELRARGTIRGRLSVGFVASRGGRHANASASVAFRLEASSKKRVAKGRK